MSFILDEFEESARIRYLDFTAFSACNCAKQKNSGCIIVEKR